MNFAVLQTSLDVPSTDSLKRAFRRTNFLAPFDAFTIARDAFGILVKRISHENALCLHGALKEEGIETEIVSEQELVRLPAVKFTNRVDCTPASLIIYDPLGRGFPIEWQHIALVSAGNVITKELKRIEMPVTPVLQDDYYNDEPLRIEYSTREVVSVKFMLEIVIKRAVIRYCLNADSRIPFRYLGDRAGQNFDTAVSLVLKDMAGFGPHIAFNRGAFYFRENAGNTLEYPSRNAFEEETSWMLWQMKKAGRL